LPAITPASGAHVKGCVYFLHGPCDSGSGLKSWLRDILDKDFTFNSYKVVYPSARKLPYYPHGNQVESVWFNQFSFHPDSPEDIVSIDNTANELSKLLVKEHKDSGIPLSNVVIGGWDQGGTMAMHLGYRFHPQIAGVFALSSSVPNHSELFAHLSEKKDPTKPLLVEIEKKEVSTPVKDIHDEVESKPSTVDFIKPLMEKYLTVEDQDPQPVLPKLFMSQGDDDPLVRATDAKVTFQKLRTSGVDGLFYSHNRHKHGLCRNQLNLLHIWIEDVLKASGGEKTNNHEPSAKHIYHWV